MIRIQLGADGLARSRFALSPVSETVNLLLAAATGTVPAPLRPRLRETIAARRLDLLAALLAVEDGAGNHIPDFLTPYPPGFEGDTAEELHAVATTPAWRVAGELAVAADGELAKLVGRTLPRRLTETDERETCERIAGELEQVWLHVLAPEWPRVRARMEADISERLQVLGRHGFGAAIDTLDPATEWHDGSVHVHGRFDADVREPAVVFLPSVFARHAATVIDPIMRCALPGEGCADGSAGSTDCASSTDGTDSIDRTDRTDRTDSTNSTGIRPNSPNPHRRPAMLFYPIPRRSPGTPPEPPRPGELIGRTRARILAAVADPATTGEVAGRLRLSPSTVSYHLQILHRAGLVRRTRELRSVLYQSTRRAG